MIYEFVFCGDGPAVGSIAAGGRYDRLIGMFSAAGAEVPCVGVSVGIERVFAIKEAQRLAAEKDGVAPSANTPNVYVASIPGEGMLEERMRVCAMLWEAGVSTEYSYSKDAKFKKQLTDAASASIPLMLYFGPDEVAAGNVKVKDLAARTEETVPRAELVAYVAAALGLAK